MPVTATNTGEKKMEAKLKRLSLSKMSGIVIDTYKSNMRKSLNADGSPMTPLSPERIAYKKKMGARFPNRPLVFTEQLMNAVEKRQLNRFSWLVSILDKVRGKVTNTGILNIGKKAGRTPWGIGSTLIKKLQSYSKSILGSQ